MSGRKIVKIITISGIERMGENKTPGRPFGSSPRMGMMRRQGCGVTCFGSFFSAKTNMALVECKWVIDVDSFFVDFSCERAAVAA